MRKARPDQQTFESFSYSSNSCIYTSASEENIEEFSIELSLGDGWNNNYSEHNKSLLKIGESILLRAHGSIVVEVKEEIRMPYNRYGIVLPTGSQFLTQGLLIASAKIEPAFHGKLKLRLFNATQEKITIKKGARLGSVIFFPTESTKIHPPIYRGSDYSTVRVSQIVEMQKWIASNIATWLGWVFAGVSGAIVGVILTYYAYYKPALEMLQQNRPAAAQQSTTQPAEATKK